MSSIRVIRVFGVKVSKNVSAVAGSGDNGMELTWLRWFQAKHLLVVAEEHGQLAFRPRSSIF
jgi:hypothetical protein